MKVSCLLRKWRIVQWLIILFEGQFKYPAVQRYLHDLTSEMGEHLDNITAALSVFIEIGASCCSLA